MGQRFKGSYTSSVTKRRWELKPQRKLSDQELIDSAWETLNKSKKKVWH